MELIKSFLIENYGIVGLFIFLLVVSVFFMAKYIVKLHKFERTEWKEERKEFRGSLDKNTEAISENCGLVKELSTILKTINKH